MSTAAAQATEIIQQAQATALILAAQSQASALVAQADSQTFLPATTQETSSGSSPELITATVEPSSSPIEESPSDNILRVELLGVRISTEGLLIEIDFLASPQVVSGWYQGTVSVTDEATGNVYNEIPVIPVVGPLIGRPIEEGQLGYVMLFNSPYRLQPGALVTVVLGEYVFEHVDVQ